MKKQEELRIGPMGTLRQQRQALIEIQQKYNQLVRAFNELLEQQEE